MRQEVASVEVRAVVGSEKHLGRAEEEEEMVVLMRSENTLSVPFRVGVVVGGELELEGGGSACHTQPTQCVLGGAKPWV